MLLSRVEDGSPAAGAGLRAGDRITAVNGRAVKDVGDYLDALRDLGDGAKVELTVQRDGKPQKLQAVLK